MTLIKVKNKSVASLPYLFRLVLRYIYEKDRMSVQDIDLMQSSIVNWNNKWYKTDEEDYHVTKLGFLLKQAEEGKFKERVETFKRTGVDWRRFHRLSEVMIIGKS